MVQWAARLLGRAQRFEAVPGNLWEAAQSRSTGYDAGDILQRVVAAAREVAAGRAAFERDSVTFSEWQAPFQLLAPLLRHALRHGGHLDVIDFGGSLGSTYRQCLPFLPALAGLRWQVVEQPHFVEAGQEFADDVLSFHLTTTGLPAPRAPRLLLASSTVQYLPEPHRLWSDAENADLGVDTVVIDRTPVWAGAEDIACVQHAPRHIYPASYPCWILSEPRLVERMSAAWRLVAQFDSAEGIHAIRRGPSFRFKGFVFERKRA